MAAASSSDAPTSRRLFIFDKSIRTSFLIDTGSAVSILPASFVNRKNFLETTTPFIELSAANGTPITVFGRLTALVYLGLPKALRWEFIVADVNFAIIGADFLASFGLLVDLQKGRIWDRSTLVSAKGVLRDTDFAGIQVVHANVKDRAAIILSSFPNIAKPPCFKAPRRHTVQHSIPTRGPPVTSRPQRLRPDLVQAAKTDVADCVRLGIMRPSPPETNWSSPVVIKRKPDNSLRICGDYRALNAITIKDQYPMPNLYDATARLAGTQIYSAVDIVRAYYNIPVSQEDQKKTALAFPFGLYEHVSMPVSYTHLTLPTIYSV